MPLAISLVCWIIGGFMGWDIARHYNFPFIIKGSKLLTAVFIVGVVLIIQQLLKEKGDEDWGFLVMLGVLGLDVALATLLTWLLLSTSP